MGTNIKFSLLLKYGMLQQSVLSVRSAFINGCVAEMCRSQHGGLMEIVGELIRIRTGVIVYFNYTA